MDSFIPVSRTQELFELAQPNLVWMLRMVYWRTRALASYQGSSINKVLNCFSRKFILFQFICLLRNLWMIPGRKQVSWFSNSPISTSLPSLAGLLQTVLEFWKWEWMSPPFLSPDHWKTSVWKHFEILLVKIWRIFNV